MDDKKLNCHYSVFQPTLVLSFPSFLHQFLDSLFVNQSYSFGDGSPWIVTHTSNMNGLDCPFITYKSIGKLYNHHKRHVILGLANAG